MVAEALSDRTAKETKTAIFSYSNLLDHAGTASATEELVAAVPGKKIVVTNINHIQVSFGGGTGSIGVEFKSGATAYTGQVTFSNIPTMSPKNDNTTNTAYMPDGHFWTAKGEALNLTITDTRTSGSAATTWVNGYINYYEE